MREAFNKTIVDPQDDDDDASEEELEEMRRKMRVHQEGEEEDEEGQMSDDSDEMNESDMSSVPSIPTSPINFDLVYALHTFNATVEGQATVQRSAHLLLLDDSNSYWWLVRVLESGDVGYIPAENIETPWERLARLNKYRNVEHAMATESDNRYRISLSAEDIHAADAKGITSSHATQGESSIRKAKASGPSVTFGGDTYVEHSGDEYDTSEYDEEEGEMETDEENDDLEQGDEQGQDTTVPTDDEEEEEGTGDLREEVVAVQAAEQNSKRFRLDAGANPDPKEDSSQIQPVPVVDASTFGSVEPTVSHEAQTDDANITAVQSKRGRHVSSESASSFTSTTSAPSPSLSSEIVGASEDSPSPRSLKTDEERKKRGVFGFFRKKKRTVSAEMGSPSSPNAPHGLKREPSTSPVQGRQMKKEDTIDPQGPSQNLTVLRIFAGGSVESDSTFKTVLVNEDTSVPSLLRQAVQRFSIREAPESFEVSVKSLDGIERPLEGRERPLKVFQQLNNGTTAPLNVSQHVRRLSTSSLSSAPIDLAQYPAITGSQTNDFSDDRAVKIYLHRKGLQAGAASLPQSRALSFRVQIFAGDLPEAGSFSEVSATKREQDESTEIQAREEHFTLPLSVSIAETIELALRQFGINGVVAGGDSVDKQERRMSMASRAQYGLVSSSSPNRTLTNNLSLQEALQQDVDGSKELIFILRRADRLQAVQPKREEDIHGLSTISDTENGNNEESNDTKALIAAQREQSLQRQHSSLRKVSSNKAGTEIQVGDSKQSVRSSRAEGFYRYSLTQADGSEYDISDIIADVWSETTGDDDEHEDNHPQSSLDSHEHLRPILERDVIGSHMTRSTSADSFDTALTSRTPNRTPVSNKRLYNGDPPGGFPDTDDDDESALQDLTSRTIEIGPQARNLNGQQSGEVGQGGGSGKLRTVAKEDVLASESVSLEDKIDEVLKRVQQDGFDTPQRSPKEKSDHNRFTEPSRTIYAAAAENTELSTAQLNSQRSVSSRSNMSNNTTVASPTSTHSTLGRRRDPMVFHEDFGLEDLIAIVYDKALEMQIEDHAKYGPSHVLPEVARHYRSTMLKLETLDDQLDQLLTQVMAA